MPYHCASFLSVVLTLQGHVRGASVGVDEQGAGAVEKGGLRLRHTKPCRNQFAPLRDLVVRHYIRGLCRTTAPGARLFPFSAVEFNRLLAQACQVLDFPTFTAHCLRHGAASHAALLGVDPEVIRRWGRWRVPRSMDTYLQQVQALLTDFSLPTRLSPFLRFLPQWRADLGGVGSGRIRCGALSV
jgi:integrase